MTLPAMHPAADQPLPSNLPHVAYVLLWYPLFTQPFIFREVENLRKIMPVEIYTLYGPNLRNCSEEMKNARPPAKVYGLKSVLSIVKELGRQFCINPVKLWRLFKRSCLRRWPDLETFGENLWGFCVGVSLGREFQERGLDYVYAPWPRGAATAAWVGASLAGIPFAVAARGDNLDPADPDLGAKLAAAAFVRANNAADKKRIEEFDQGQAAGRVELVYNSLTLPQNPNRHEPLRLPPRILALGRFDVTKGFDVLLRACGILKQKNFPFTLTLAGGGGKVMGLGDLASTLFRMRRELDLENEVSMPGLISHDELPGILARHDIFAAPCVIHSSGRRDGIPNTVIEAMSSGLPVISTNVNALPEIVHTGRTGIAVPPDDPNALAEAIIQLCANPEGANKMGDNGQALAKELFDPETNAARLATLFSKYPPKHKNGEKPCAA